MYLIGRQFGVNLCTRIEDSQQQTDDITWEKNLVQEKEKTSTKSWWKWMPTTCPPLTLFSLLSLFMGCRKRILSRRRYKRERNLMSSLNWFLSLFLAKWLLTVAESKKKEEEQEGEECLVLNKDFKIKVSITWTPPTSLPQQHHHLRSLSYTFS